MCVLNVDSGELNMPEDVPSLPDRAEFAREVASVLVRYLKGVFSNLKD